MAFNKNKENCNCGNVECTSIVKFLDLKEDQNIIFFYKYRNIIQLK